MSVSSLKDLAMVNNSIYIEDIMKYSYVDYALSTMVRGIPLTSDGLKPSQRRILTVLFNHRKHLVKSARIVGDTLGMYHPHGDSSVYDAMETMVQDFRQNCPLINGQGNWGSIDGDHAAAYRYTEAAISNFALDAYFGPEHVYCDYKDNFDGTMKEPMSLSPKVPVHLINGVRGIVTGYATNIPPHNISEICDASIAYIRGDIKGDRIDKYLLGPDFPTGSYVYTQKDVLKGMTTGKSSFDIVPSYIITEHLTSVTVQFHDIPYATNKTSFIENIVSKLKNPPDKGFTKREREQAEHYASRIKNITDTSGREGIFVDMEFKRGVTRVEVEKIISFMIDKNIIKYDYRYTLFAMEYNGGDDANIKDYNDTSDIVHTSGKTAIVPMRYTMKSLIGKWYEYRCTVLTRYFNGEIRNLEERIDALRQVQIFINNYKKLSQSILDEPNEKVLKEIFLKYGIRANGYEYILSSSFRRFRNKAEDIMSELNKMSKTVDEHKYNLEKTNEYIISELKDIKKKYGKARHSKIIKQGL